MRLFATVSVLSLAVPAAFAAIEPTPVTLPAGVVACVNYREARNYTSYSANAPEFAEDLINRAACFKNKEPMPAVTKAVVSGYTQLQLLSGHRVWLPSKALSSN